MTDQEATLVRPQPFDQWQRDLGATEAEAVRVRGVGERPRGDEPAADAGPAGESAPAADAGPSAAADADVAPPLPEPEPAAPQPKPKRGGSRRRTPKE